MSSLVMTQHEFLMNVAELLKYAEQHGYIVTGGELWRPIEMQKLYVQTGRSKTMQSQHLNRLAIDLNFFSKTHSGTLKLLSRREDIAELGKLWENMNANNRWGGSWRGKIESGRYTFIDIPHFERTR